MDIYIVRHGQTDSNLAKVFNTYIEDITKSFIDFAIKYSKEHTDIKYIIESKPRFLLNIINCYLKTVDSYSAL